MTEWIAGIDRIPITGVDHQPFRGGPIRVVLHKMQGGLIGSLLTYPKTKAVPHFSWDYPTRRRIQHRPLNEMASALQNKPGGVETNADGAIQIEISGYSEDAPDLTDAELVWYGEGLAELRGYVDFQLVTPEFKDEDDAIGVHSSTRMTFAEWDVFNGVCGHQHVPENDHWDPGELNIRKVLAAAGATTKPPEEDMPAQIVRHEKRGGFYVIRPDFTVAHIDNLADLKRWQDTAKLPGSNIVDSKKPDGSYPDHSAWIETLERTK